jgi:S-adenosylmethionine decarboxylase
VQREPLPLGVEWVVDAHGCVPERLRSADSLARVFDRIVNELGLHPAAPPTWKVFGGEGGVTGLLLLSESHLACHTFPERGFAAFDLYCCRPREEWPWEERLREALGASHVVVRRLTRGEP